MSQHTGTAPPGGGLGGARGGSSAGGARTVGILKHRTAGAASGRNTGRSPSGGASDASFD